MPTKYIADYSKLPLDESFDFIRSSYELTPKEYYDIYSRIDKISNISWWSKLLVSQKARIQEGITRREGKAVPIGNNLSGSLRSNLRKAMDIVEKPLQKRVKFV
jgi:hypothetical protein